MAFVNGNWFNANKNINGIIEIRRLIDEDNTLDSGYIYLGTYTFVISPTLPTIALNPREVASDT